MFGYLGYGAASAVLGAVLYANLPTKYTIGAIVPTAKFLAEAKLKKINGEKDLLTAKEIKARVSQPERFKVTPTQNTRFCVV